LLNSSSNRSKGALKSKIMRLSVITVNLNNRQGLAKTLESVFAQTFKDFELIVIDGASTDGSVEVITDNKDKIAYWISEKDHGIYHAMNKGIAMARGEYCYFLNSGDYLVGKDVFAQVFAQDIYADIVSGNVLKIRNNGKHRTIRPHDVPSLHKLCIHSLPHQASFIRRALFGEIGMYNEEYRIVSDFEFFVKALIVHGKSYKKIDTNFSFFNLNGISSNPANFGMAKEESYRCLKANFPSMVDDLMDYRYFYVSNIGQLVRLLEQKKKLYQRLDNFVGWIFRLKKAIVGK